MQQTRAVTLLSPELAGFTDPTQGSFTAGNVLTTDLGATVRQAHRLWYVRDFARGLARCRSECGFYAFCLGAHASNRYFEHGDLTTTETTHCRLSKQALVTATLATTQEEQRESA